MLRSGFVIRNALGVLGAGAVILGGAAVASAQPAPPPPPPAPGCTAADLAQVSGSVGTAMGNYLFTHPDVNNFFTSLRGLPNEEVRGKVQDYMNANRQVESEINGIRSPLTDLRSSCDAPAR